MGGMEPVAASATRYNNICLKFAVQPMHAQARNCVVVRNIAEYRICLNVLLQTNLEHSRYALSRYSGHRHNAAPLHGLHCKLPTNIF